MKSTLPCRNFKRVINTVRYRTIPLSAGATAICLWLSGCASVPQPTGFLRDYSRLEVVEPGWMRYVSPELSNYSSFLVDPVQIRIDRDVLDDAQRAEVARYMHEALVRVLRSRDIALATEPAVGRARMRIAITDIQESKWYLNVHPATKLSGTGRGGASMEAEVIDSVSGKQLAASIRVGRGREFELNPFSTIQDVKDVIDRWAQSAGDRLDEMRRARSR